MYRNFKFEFGKIGDVVLGRVIGKDGRIGKIKQRANALADDYLLVAVPLLWNKNDRKTSYWDLRKRYKPRIVKILRAKGMR